jgi:hypothetical protein
MLLPTLSDLPATSPLATWLRYYCRLGYEATLHCRGADDPDSFCQLLVNRRQTLSQLAQRQLQLDYQLNEPQAQRLFTQWSRRLFSQLLTQDVMRQVDLQAALHEPLPT